MDLLNGLSAQPKRWISTLSIFELGSDSDLIAVEDRWHEQPIHFGYCAG